MTITNGYTTLVDLQNRLGVSGAAQETLLEGAITAASRAIDRFCRRRFYVDGSVSTRQYEARHPYRLEVDDFSTTTGLVIATDDNDDGTAENTWAASDYELRPLNGVVDGTSGWPYTTIRAVNEVFPLDTRRAGVHVTAKWGWASCPSDVAEACLIKAHRLYIRKDTPTGVQGNDQFGFVRISRFEDPDVEMLLAPYRRMDGIA